MFQTQNSEFSPLHKQAVNAWIHLPNASLIDALIARLRAMTPQQIDAAQVAARDAAQGAAWDAARDAAWDAARDAAWYAARDAARVATRDTAWDAALDAAWDTVQVAAWGAAFIAGALVAWDDMPEFLRLTRAELDALRAVADGTPTAHKALAAVAWRIYMGDAA